MILHSLDKLTEPVCISDLWIMSCVSAKYILRSAEINWIGHLNIRHLNGHSRYDWFQAMLWWFWWFWISDDEQKLTLCMVFRVFIVIFLVSFALGSRSIIFPTPIEYALTQRNRGSEDDHVMILINLPQYIWPKDRDSAVGHGSYDSSTGSWNFWNLKALCWIHWPSSACIYRPRLHVGTH